jgi:hypothetical protein
MPNLPFLPFPLNPELRNPTLPRGFLTADAPIPLYSALLAFWRNMSSSNAASRAGWFTPWLTTHDTSLPWLILSVNYTAMRTMSIGAGERQPTLSINFPLFTQLGLLRATSAFWGIVSNVGRQGTRDPFGVPQGVNF